MDSVTRHVSRIAASVFTADVAENLEQLDQAMLEGIMARDALVFPLCAPEEVERSRQVSEHTLESARSLIQHYDIVIVDGSRALDGLLLSCMERRNDLWVLTQEFPAVRMRSIISARSLASGTVISGQTGCEPVRERGSLHVSMEQLQTDARGRAVLGLAKQV